MKKINFLLILITLFTYQLIFATEHIVINSNKTYSNEIFENYEQQYLSSNSSGGVFYIKDNGILSLNFCEFKNNKLIFSDNFSGKKGGGSIYNLGYLNIYTGTKFINNTSTLSSYGGAIYNEKNIHIEKDVEFAGNFGVAGGAIYNSGSITIGENINFECNRCHSHGGAIYNIGEIVIDKDVKFIGNIAAIYNYKKLSISENAIFENNITSQYDYYAAIGNYGTITIDEGTKFKNNKFNGFHPQSCVIYNSGTMFIKGATFSKNSMLDIYNIGNLYFSTGTTKMDTGIGGLYYNNYKDKDDNKYIEINNGASLIFMELAILQQKDLLIKENSSLEINASNLEIANSIKNDGIIVFNGGENDNIIIGDGIIKINNTFLNKSSIYAETIYINGIFKGIFFNTQNTTIFDKSLIDLIDNKIQFHNFKNLKINSGTINLNIDADLEKKEVDIIYAESFEGEGEIKVMKINILKDAKNVKTEIEITSSTILKDKITSVNIANSKIFKYDVFYDKKTGILNFKNYVVSPTLFESQVANSVGGFVTQTTIFNQAFASMENIKSRILQVKNEIPVDAPLYASRANTIFFQKTNRIESGLWLRPFYSQEMMNLDNLPVDNTLTGTLAGLDLATGENSLVSLYLGYAGSEQKYENIKVSQTGYILGTTGMLAKEQWYAGVTANINFNKAESQSSYGTDNFDMNMYSVGAKAGYNFDLSDKWKLEPNLMLMYGNVNSQEYQTKQGAKVEGQSVANIIFEPQIKAKLNLENGWQPYGLIGYVVNAGDKVTTKVEEVEFDGQKIGNYVEFGAGIDKSFKNSPWSLYVQLTGRSGGRTGLDGNFGIKYSFLTAKEKKKISKIKKIQAKRKAKEEFIREKKKEGLKKQQELKKERRRIEKARIEEEQKKEKEKLREQKDLEEERRRKEKAEQEKQQELEIQKQIEEYY